LAFEDTVPARMKVFARDRQLQTTVLASPNATGSGGGNGDSFPSGISANGQFVVFESVATDLFAGNTNTNTIKNVYARDIVDNITTLVSVSTNGTEGNGDSHDAAITPDGRYVVFASAASNLTPGDTNRIPDIFVRDLTLGVTTLASPGAVAGTKVSPLSPNWSSECPLLSSDGRYVAFYSTAIGLVSNVTSAGELYVRDLVKGTTSWASANAHLVNSSAISANYAMSTNGQWIAYQSTGGNPGGLVFRYHVCDGNVRRHRDQRRSRRGPGSGFAQYRH
jgi:Tol biopolymer transport system component